MNDSENASLGQWLFRLFAWDGLLPLSIWMTPVVLQLLFPNNNHVIEITAIALPIAAFWVRYVVGRRYIRANGCGPIMRRFQTVIFCAAIFLLVLIDSLMILFQEFAKGPFLDLEALVIMSVPYSIYLCAMAFALYPGFRSRSDMGSESELRAATRMNAFGGEEYV